MKTKASVSTFGAVDDPLRASLGRHVDSGEVPGLVAGVEDGRGLRVQALGVRRAGTRELVQRDTLFRISSMTKPVTGVAAMILVEEGRVALDEPVDRLLPELANRRVLTRLDAPLDETVPARRAITVRDLLTFTFGMGILMAPPGTHPIQSAMDDLTLGQGIPSPSKPPPPDEWIRRLGTLPLMHQPGEGWMYNTGADVLGVLVARASGKSFDAFLAERLFEPLAMKDTGFFVPAAKLDRFTPSYVANPESGALELYDEATDGQWSRPPAFPGGGAGLVSTVDDYLAFQRMMLGKGAVGSTRILSAESVELMTRDHLTPQQRSTAHYVPGYFDRLGWGFCMGVVTRADPLGRAMGTYGWDGGLGASGWVDPVRGRSGVILTQRSFTSPEPSEVVKDFWRAASTG